MASADLRQELGCSICLNIYTDPVTLRCGHNFCQVCIDRVLETQEEFGVYTCPECRAACMKRPALQRNITLCNIVGSFLSTLPDQEETGIFCTYCVDSPVPAAKSCLLCEASLCDKHLRVHSKSAEHVLSDPTTSLGNRKCFIHKKIFQYYCSEDAACICVYCSAGQHRRHLVQSLDEASQKKKEILRNFLQKLTTKKEETDKNIQSLQEHRRKDQEKAAGVTERATALFRDIRRQLEDLEKSVLSEISRQEESVSLSVSDLIQQLELKKDELSRKMHHIEELCNMPDPVTVLQERCKIDLCDTEVRERHDEQVHDVGDLDVGLISETLHTLSDIIAGIKKGIYVQQATDILLDVNISNITLSEIITGINTGIYVQDPTDLLLDVNTAGERGPTWKKCKMIYANLHPGDLVLIKVHQKKNSLSPKWKDPYQVLLVIPTADKLSYHMDLSVSMYEVCYKNMFNVLKIFSSENCNWWLKLFDFVENVCEYQMDNM
ncbi:E3 ubiquitin/ISG15 ligase TRIM25-like [Mixophyes fleayi]|uniref:E3 ubiquitin/ISG15 ligase TRIM25-like n=1 Tax=Mixophyes fleayi TaxID=3061075 RepID=UPI003F4E018E